MEWHTYTVESLPRLSPFLFRVSGLSLCRQLSRPGAVCPSPSTSSSYYEVCLRLASGESCCEDTINGERQHVSFPNVAWKLPGELTFLSAPSRRDTVAFYYAPDVMEAFFRIGMRPRHNCQSVVLTSELRRQVSDLRKLIVHLYSPGVADQIDWLCFQVYKSLLSESYQPSHAQEEDTIVRNISMWLQLHYDQAIDMAELARQHGMSHTRFYRSWKRVFSLTPTQYLLDYRLKAAACKLLQTDLPIAAIVQEVYFSGLYAFHQKFKAKFGMSPRSFRLRYACLEAASSSFPDLLDMPAALPDGQVEEG